MALTVDEDEQGTFAVLACDRSGCARHGAGRPIPPMSAYDLVCVLYDEGEANGWTYWKGSAYCPDHLPRALGRTRTLAERFSHLRVVNGPKRALRAKLRRRTAH